MNQRQGFFQVDTKLLERLEEDASRPYDWQDKIVIAASLVSAVFLLIAAIV